ncbi:MAG: hypothetical protein CEO12_60 [Parcubacteria group bacterium Gr01-1014_46]|nr:MAG: hypothetical protein CEO12_60 [Parcubacteria group bacterium Gr01-1014_46]
MRVGSLQERANWFLVGFVFGCIFIIILLLYAMVKAEQKADYLDSVSLYYVHNPKI